MLDDGSTVMIVLTCVLLIIVEVTAFVKGYDILERNKFISFIMLFLLITTEMSG